MEGGLLGPLWNRICLVRQKNLSLLVILLLIKQALLSSVTNLSADGKGSRRVFPAGGDGAPPFDRKGNNSEKSDSVPRSHNGKRNGRRPALSNGFAHYPQGFPHRYVNTRSMKKLENRGEPRNFSSGDGKRALPPQIPAPCRGPASSAGAGFRRVSAVFPAIPP